MSSAYLSYKTGDPDVEQHAMPPYASEDLPDHELGHRIYIRLLTKNQEGDWSADWEEFRMNERFGRNWVPGAAFWWEEKKQWLHPEETPDEVGLEHGHTIRIVHAKDPEIYDTVPLARLHAEESS